MKETYMARVSVQRAAELMGVTPLTIRVGIANGELPIGVAIHTGKLRTNYHISPAKLADYLGLTVEQIKGVNDRKEE